MQFMNSTLLSGYVGYCVNCKNMQSMSNTKLVTLRFIMASTTTLIAKSVYHHRVTLAGMLENFI
jgi:hypothetical protein